jgi:hypothetical protein
VNGVHVAQTIQPRALVLHRYAPWLWTVDPGSCGFGLASGCNFARYGGYGLSPENTGVLIGELLLTGAGLMQARIYQPSRSAMTSGMGNSRAWVLEYVPTEARQIDPLMGWTGSGDMNRQVRLKFETEAAAVDHAQNLGLAYTVEAPKKRRANIRPQGYAGNFAYNRRGAWTH